MLISLVADGISRGFLPPC